jgi:SAM-dependent methyltransferase
MESIITSVLNRVRVMKNRVRVMTNETDSTNPLCKICGASTCNVFSLPSSKLTGHPIPDGDSDCRYYECTICHFLFCEIHDDIDHEELYDETYWDTQDPDWGGRVNQTLRLVLMANNLLGMEPWKLKVLDFGCGMGTFVEAARDQLQLQSWGTDIIKPKFGLEWFLPDPPKSEFDIVVSCEVIEHLPRPFEILSQAVASLRPGGVFAFQTAQYDPAACGRDWWYLGPANGHISLYSREAFDVLAERLGVKNKLMWNNYPGLQAWQF